MSVRRPISFWRYSLNAELLAAGLAGLVLLVGSWITLRQLEQRYLALFRTDAERVNLYLHEHLATGIAQLERLAARAPEQDLLPDPLVLQPFSDLYLMDASQRIRQVLKATPGSRVFPGFSFAGSRIQSYLRQAAASSRPAAGSTRPAPTPATSAITRGLEDELASIYVQRPLPGARPTRWLLGRLNLRYIQGFLKQYSRFSGTPVLLVSNDGFVMLSGHTLNVPAIDLRIAASSGGAMRPITLEGQEWLPIVAADTGLGSRVVTLVPLQRLRQQQQVVLLAAAVAALLIALVLLVKNLRVRQRLFLPVRRFASHLQQLEARFQAPGPSFDPTAPASVSAAGEFEEIQQIQSSFEALMGLISQRDLTLQQQLRTSLTAAAIAHEINLPLGTLLMLCDQAQRQLESGQGEIQVADLVASLQQQSQEVSRVIERMRMLLRNVRTELRPTSLTDVVTSACAYVRQLLREHQVQLTCTGLEGESGEVLGDAGQLKTAITNLLRNGIEAAASQPPERRQLEVRLERRAAARGQGQELVLHIADSGPGFAFAPGDDTLFQTTKAGGSGLGLFVVRTTLANHQGRLEIGQSASLGGAQVSLVLPSATSPEPCPGPLTPTGSSRW